MLVKANSLDLTEAKMKEIEKEMEDVSINDVQTIRKFRLKNQGGFITRLEFSYFDKQMNKYHVEGTGNITLGCSKSADPGDYGVPEGALVTVFAYVMAGRDIEGKQWFVYNKNSNHMANFVISGTTYHNDLGFIGITDID